MTVNARIITNDRKSIEKNLENDLKLYAQKAIEFGASDAKIILSREVIVDERVRLKCSVPKCPLYGSSPSCPPCHQIIGRARTDSAGRVVFSNRWARCLAAPRISFNHANWHG